ncbi:hypothetical protein H4219_004250 [Mycoemilia scoparia]|uniref:F-box domain-containing protein n=1 Tax=Mycoemilia scoparia TaxID=417184 RepID=A0A9W8A1S8_9FUNG|nr:hypothetical protein H4219_004250 [Mycoemilia scoparia]
MQLYNSNTTTSHFHKQKNSNLDMFRKKHNRYSGGLMSPTSPSPATLSKTAAEAGAKGVPDSGTALSPAPLSILKHQEIGSRVSARRRMWAHQQRHSNNKNSYNDNIDNAAKSPNINGTAADAFYYSHHHHHHQYNPIYNLLTPQTPDTRFFPNSPFDPNVPAVVSALCQSLSPESRAELAGQLLLDVPLDIMQPVISQLNALEKWDFVAVLPHELIINIFSYLPALEVVSNVSLVCQSWRNASRDSILWKSLFYSHGYRVDEDALRKRIASSNSRRKRLSCPSPHQHRYHSIPHQYQATAVQRAATAAVFGQSAATTTLTRTASTPLANSGSDAGSSNDMGNNIIGSDDGMVEDGNISDSAMQVEETASEEAVVVHHLRNPASASAANSNSGTAMTFNRESHRTANLGAATFSPSMMQLHRNNTTATSASGEQNGAVCGSSRAHTPYSPISGNNSWLSSSDLHSHDPAAAAAAASPSNITSPYIYQNKNNNQIPIRRNKAAAAAAARTGSSSTETLATPGSKSLPNSPAFDFREAAIGAGPLVPPPRNNNGGLYSPLNAVPGPSIATTVKSQRSFSPKDLMPPPMPPYPLPQSHLASSPWMPKQFSHYLSSTAVTEIDWLRVFKYRHHLEMNWRRGKHKSIMWQRAHEDSIYCLQFDNKGKLITGGRDRRLYLWDMSDHYDIKRQRTFRGHRASVLCLQFEGDTLVSGSSDSTIIVWDIPTGKRLHVLNHSDSVLGLKFNDKYLVTCSKDCTVKVWDRKTFKYIKTLRGHNLAINSVQLVGDKVVSASGDRTIWLWDIPSGSCLLKLSDYERGFASIDYDGEYIVAGSSDNMIRMWSAQTGQLVRSFEGHTGLVRTLMLNQRLGFLVSGSYDHTVKVWDLQTGKLLNNLGDHHMGHVLKLQFSDTKIVSCSQDQSIAIHDFGFDVKYQDLFN